LRASGRRVVGVTGWGQAVAKRARVGTQSRRWFAIEAVAAVILAGLAVVQLLAGPGGRHRIFPVVELVGAVLMATGVLVEWVRNGPRA